MAFYDLTADKRRQLVNDIHIALVKAFRNNDLAYFHKIFGDNDTYIRKTGYLVTGKIFTTKEIETGIVLSTLENLIRAHEYHIRQTAINAAGEIGKYNFDIVAHFFDRGLFDDHHTVRNAVIGSIKKMGEKNPVPVLAWARQYLHHPDKEIRREICHGIELRGRKHPEDILPLLKQLEHDSTARVRNTLVHVLGQISYKKGCLEKVMAELQAWDNKELVAKAINEIIDVHKRYSNFSFYSQGEAISVVENLNSIPYRI